MVQTQIRFASLLSILKIKSFCEALFKNLRKEGKMRLRYVYLSGEMAVSTIVLKL